MSSSRQDPSDLLEAECESLQSNSWADGDNFVNYPNAAALIESAIAAIEKSIPDRFEHDGRTYRLRSKLKRLDLGIHKDPASARPLLRLETESLRWLGFKPGH
ncbi:MULTISPECIES: hypothetical protein [unclassified Thiomonas]|uniref:hypothetical protein n=1 Tax=unclassified Thiomonas TaxID=2625466 RepID=UPI0004DBAF7A|nr:MULTISPECIES: hypothetical protein [unclassified Thiomonas]CDW92232.1 hypothetical protein THICB2_10016 [Thiomonas sp. CB2]VDY06613.1 protein of unknown function [Thiomonas sp. Bio17B3]VDY10092.1 protein of unknown function [Thiomonas sp. Sup16B3]VDY14884.1 conserved protein of unknown function [Thiomonas sp. OC7]VDY15937.1 protein of unknown function [Thiomonas sp. CB2]